MNNRSLDGWTTFGQGSIDLNINRPLSSALPAQLRYTINQNSTVPSGFKNGGFYGIRIQAQNYTASFFYKPSSRAYVAGGKVTIGLMDSTGQITYGNATIDVSKAPVDMWSNFSSTIRVLSNASSTNNSFFVEFPIGSNGSFEFNILSCFPPTYKNRKNGARIDIAQALADLKPGFVRFPGGDDLEGLSIPERFIWNNTIGPLENRPGRRGRWTGYNTEGFGLLELLTFTEDIGATPVLAVYAGFSYDQKAVPKDQLQSYVDEVVNELDFLMAPVSSNRMGRKEPFNVKYVEIGNEDGLRTAPQTYSYRWPAFHNALSQHYPNITYIATTLKSIDTPPAVDNHDYRNPLYFIQNFRRFENVSRAGPKQFVGEFSVITDDDTKMNEPLSAVRLQYPSIKSAVAESIYRMGFERNSDIVIGGSYAPLLQNVDNTQWTPNLIVFNATLVVRSTSYLAQKMFGEHLGNLLLNSTATNCTMAHQSIAKGQEGDGKLGNLYFVATKRINDNTLIVKLASVDPSDILVKAQIQGSTISSTGLAYILTAGPGIDPSTVHNTMENPNAASIATMPVSATNGTWSITVPSWSVVVVTLTL